LKKNKNKRPSTKMLSSLMMNIMTVKMKMRVKF
jgi:hypothetical protein